jgi:hypothetical protein
MKRAVAFLLSLSFCCRCPPDVRADEGMWTFDNPPLKQWKERYNFEPTKEWLDHVRLASARLQDGGSGAFVSPDGLVMTNQHVAGGQLAKLSTKERDLTKEGFYAPTRAEELKAPDLEINVLVSYEDVTSRVQGAAKAGASDREANEQRKAEIAAIEKESTEKTKLKSEVVTLYSGGEYWLYRYKKYTDVRLVFAPEEQIAFFGGDYDNFTYPRYNLDVTFLRVYETGSPPRPNTISNGRPKARQTVSSSCSPAAPVRPTANSPSRNFNINATSATHCRCRSGRRAATLSTATARSARSRRAAPIQAAARSKIRSSVWRASRPGS